ncbi:ribosomal protein S5 domain 2-type protein [Pisolithus marmoratus]|nr:ribosomal protein S5 domain 2-type protein [Pisolithus marmoratus]
MSNLDTVVRSPQPTPVVVATSQEIRDRGSIFVGSAYRATSPEEAQAALHYHKHVVHAGKDVYEISAWRCMVLKLGRTGLSGPDDFELRTGFDDGGEQWAGSKVLKIMQTEGVIDAIVIVSRWFGGTLLGPTRFRHVETCASEVCCKFNKVVEMDESIQTLSTLDDLLATLREELDALKPDTSETRTDTSERPLMSKVHDYSAMREALDLSKARRLIHARESAIQAVKSLIAKHKGGE